MSCQQVSRFITTTPSIINTNTAVPTIPIAAATTPTITAAALINNSIATTAGVGAGAEAALVSIKPATAIAASTALSTTTSSIASLTAATAEDQDPYVFTESVHATPPVHFNAQKTRIRHVDSAALTAATTITDTDTISTAATTTTHVNTTTVESLSSTATITSTTTAVTNCNAVSTVTTTSTSMVSAATSTSPIKNVTQQQQQYKRQTLSKSPLLLTSAPLSPTLAAVCVQQQQQQQQHTKVLSPTCGLQLTPSLWQTPLLLDTNASNSSNTIPTTNYNNNNITSNNGNNFVAVATTATAINSPMHSPTAVTAALLANITHSAIPLPPSNFHHTTLAQHLQKVECIKKPPNKRQNSIATQKVVMTLPPTTPTTTTSSSSSSSILLPPPLQPLQTCNEQTQQQQQPKLALYNRENKQCVVGDDKQQQQQQNEHSDTDLNEIPVNVIFRKPQTTTATTTQAVTNIKEMPTKKTTTTTTKTIETQKQSFEQPKLVTLISAPIIQQQQQQLLSKPTLIMPCTKVDIEAAVSTLQSMQLKALKEGSMSANVQQQQQQQEQQQNYLNVKQVTNVNKIISNTTIPATKNIAQKTEITTTSNKKSRGKQQLLIPAALHQNSLAADHGSAVAVVKMSSSEVSADISDLSNAIILPYCVQKHWLNTEYPQKHLISREERIAQSKNVLRRQALQLLNTHSLQKLPLHAARKRLICVDRLLSKYDEQKMHTDRLHHSNKLCHTAGCQNRALEMASHCWQHITQNTTQQIFQTCAAVDAQNTQCVTPVFDMLHELPLCELHEKQRDVYELKLKNNNNNNNKIKVIATNNCMSLEKQKQYKTNSTNDLLQQPKQIILQQQMPQLQKIHMNNKMNINNNNKNNNNVINIKPVKAQTTRKRKSQLVNEVARAQKRVKKCVATTTIAPATTTTTTTQVTMPRINVNGNCAHLTKAMIANTSIMLSSVAPAPSPPPPLLQRKSSTTSLESIGSTSYNSASPPQHCYSYYSELQQHQQQQQQQQHQQQQQQQQQQNHLNYVNAVPALAPLSFGFSNPFVNSTNGINNSTTNNNNNSNHHHNSNQNTNINNNNNNSSNNHNGSSIMFNTNLNATISAADLKEHEINQIVSQFTMLHNNQTLNSNGHSSDSQIVFNSYNNTSNSNLNFLNTNSDSNFTSALSTDELLTQDMMSICENSSAYASSEDTGLGGLSETELIAAHDEDIPLGDTRLLEEHDLANVLSALPDDAFNELFTAGEELPNVK